MRLIDADKLKEYFTDDDLPNIFQSAILDAIDLHPTAYDIDKVVEELDNTSHWTESSFDEDGYSNDDSEEVVYLNKAIEIVKRGGVGKDVSK